MWESQGQPFSYTGTHYSVDAVLNLPPPPSPISVGVGGSGPRVLDLIAAEADEWNCPASMLENYTALRRTFEDALARHGRRARQTLQIVFAPGQGEPPPALAMFNPHLGLRGSTSQMVDRLGELAAQGVTGVFGMVTDRAALETMAEALPQLRDVS